MKEGGTFPAFFCQTIFLNGTEVAGVLHDFTIRGYSLISRNIIRRHLVHLVPTRVDFPYPILVNLPRYHVTLCVHALEITEVISFLGLPAIFLTVAGARSRPHQQSAAGS